MLAASGRSLVASLLGMTDWGFGRHTALTWYREGRRDLLASYSETCLRRVWRVQHFSWWYSEMLHRFDDAGGFDERVQLSQLRYVTSSKAGMTTIAENYVGLDAD